MTFETVIAVIYLIVAVWSLDTAVNQGRAVKVGAYLLLLVLFGLPAQFAGAVWGYLSGHFKTGYYGGRR